MRIEVLSSLEIFSLNRVCTHRNLDSVYLIEFLNNFRLKLCLPMNCKY